MIFKGHAMAESCGDMTIPRPYHMWSCSIYFLKISACQLYIVAWMTTYTGYILNIIFRR